MADRLSSSRREHNESESSSSSSNKRLHVIDADRLSKLPLEIQNQILSFLPTIDAAKMGMLSTFWRATFNSLSKLSFHYSQFPETENKPLAFFNFINQTLAFHDESDIKTLEVSLWPFTDYDIPIMSSWIMSAILHKVEKLVLYGEIAELQLPDCLLTCQTLIKLELAMPGLVLTSSKILALPNLRKLKLKFLVLSVLTLDHDLFSNLPALEKLSIFSCYLGSERYISVSSMKLKEFTICNCPGMGSCFLKLRAPSLSNFIYISDAFEKSRMKVYSSGFQFLINGGDAFVVSGSTNELSPSVIKVIKELFRNRPLSLSIWFIEYLSKVHDLPRHVHSDIFLDLMKLHINIWPNIDHLRALVLLVSRCPQLDVLCIILVFPRRQGCALPWEEDSLVEYGNAGGFQKVSFVRIVNFEGEETELMLVKFLLASMSQLRLMRIVINGFKMDHIIMPKISEITGYERASAFADIKFSYYY